MPFVGWVIRWTRLGRYPLIVQQLAVVLLKLCRRDVIYLFAGQLLLRVMQSVIFNYVNTGAYVKQVILIAV